MHLTNWFPHDVKPVRKGVYQIRYKGDIDPYGYCRWNGDFWLFTAPDVKTAEKSTMKGTQDKAWRGIKRV